jgi:hypothetical protein
MSLHGKLPWRDGRRSAKGELVLSLHSRLVLHFGTIRRLQLTDYWIQITLHINGSKQKSDEGAALFAVRVHVIVIRHDLVSSFTLQPSQTGALDTHHV